MLTARAANFALEGPAPPDWIQLLPAGPAITGSDGRAWKFPDPQPLISAFQSRNKPLVVDFEHSSEHRAPHGLEAPAAGWIDRLEARDGSVWGHVDWTPKAAAHISAKEYRFLSPVFTYRKADSAIAQLVSAGLTNQPNLNLTALNQEQPMDMTAICKALGIDSGSDLPAILAAIKALTDDESAEPDAKAAQQAVPSLDKYIPRPDYDAALARAVNAEEQLKALGKSQHDEQVKALIERALTDRKICPATVDFYTAVCQEESGIDRFKAFLDQTPALIGPASNRAGAPPEPDDQAVIARAFKLKAA
jgi:phage I-like protein